MSEPLVTSYDDSEGFRPMITICRDIPGEHIGGPGCFCVPETFLAEDYAAIQRFLDTQHVVS